MPARLERKTAEASYTSTGHMPSGDPVERRLTEARQRYRSY